MNRFQIQVSVFKGVKSRFTVWSCFNLFDIISSSLWPWHHFWSREFHTDLLWWQFSQSAFSYEIRFETFIANCWMSWGLLVLAELSVVKALSIYKFSWVVNIDEVFAGRFLLRLNLGYILFSQTSRFVSKLFVQYSWARANLNKC